MNDPSKLLVILTQGIADNGKKATLAFSMGLTGLALNQDVTIFLTSDGAAWGIKGTSKGVSVPGFSALETLIDEYAELGGKIIICSTCQNTCSAGNFAVDSNVDVLECAAVAGMATVLEIANGATCLTF